MPGGTVLVHQSNSFKTHVQKKPSNQPVSWPGPVRPQGWEGEGHIRVGHTAAQGDAELCHKGNNSTFSSCFYVEKSRLVFVWLVGFWFWGFFYFLFVCLL